MKIWPFAKQNSVLDEYSWEHRELKSAPAFRDEDQRDSYYSEIGPPSHSEAYIQNEKVILLGAETGKGKITDCGYDLWDAYYTKLPAGYDFVFTATITADSFLAAENRTNQEGFGLFIRDTIEPDPETGYQYSNMIACGAYCGGWNVFGRDGLTAESIENVRNHYLYGKDRCTETETERLNRPVTIRLEKKGQVLSSSIMDAKSGADLLIDKGADACSRDFDISSSGIVSLRVRSGAFEARDKEQYYIGIMAAGCSVSFKTKDVELNVTGNVSYINCSKEIYVSPEGSYFGAGTKDDPVGLQTAIDTAAEETIVLMPGRYSFENDITIKKNNSGSAECRKKIMCPEKYGAILDFKRQEHGFSVYGDYWEISGITVANGMGFKIQGSYNHLINCLAENNMETGILIRHDDNDSAKQEWPSHNIVEDCISRYNLDPSEHNADGFACKVTVGEGNKFVRCLAYLNTDDGFDLFAKNRKTGAVDLIECISCLNGYKLTHDDLVETKGNGNGFKLGGSGLSISHKAVRCEAYCNKSTGFTSNSNPVMTLIDCTAGNNLKHNYEYYFRGKNSVPMKTMENCSEQDSIDADISAMLSKVDARCVIGGTKNDTVE